MATPAEMWDYIPGSGISTGASLVELHSRAQELHLIHGLKLGSPLTVTATTRNAGVISQTISEAGGIVTVERLP
jgi:hypothetical protein